MTSSTLTATMRRLERRAMALVLFGAAYNVVEFFVSEVAGFIAGSVALIGFGLDSAIEVSASGVVFVHLLRRDAAEESAWEQRIATYVGITFVALAGFVAAKAFYDLATASRPDESYAGIALAGASLAIMPVVARLKHDLAHRVNSRALEAESRETLVCSYLSGALLLGLGANALLGWWWADPIAGLVIVAALAKEGWEAFTRKELCCID